VKPQCNDICARARVDEARTFIGETACQPLKLIQTPHPLPFPRIFENSQKNLRRARIKKFFRKWQALPKKIRDFWQFCSNFGGVLVILGHIFFVDFYFGGSGILTIGN